MENTLVGGDSTLVLWMILMLTSVLGFWVDSSRFGKKISGIAIVLIVSMMLSNFGAIPKSAAAYDLVWTYLVPLAIPLLLLKANLRRIVSESRMLLIAFILGALGTLVGAVAGFLILPLGIDGHKLAAVLSSTYIGGSMNMVAIMQAVDLDAAQATASVAADNVVGVIYLAFLAVVPSIMFLNKWYRLPSVTEKSASNPSSKEEPVDVILNPLHMALVMGISFSICALGNWLAIALGLENFSIVMITLITLVLANTIPDTLDSIMGGYEIGLLFMYLFFVVVGASADVAILIDQAAIIALYAAIIVLFHMVFIFGGNRLLKLDSMEIVIASNACVSGAASAAAFAAVNGRRDLVAPAVLLGVFGYATANFIGVGLWVILGG